MFKVHFCFGSYYYTRMHRCAHLLHCGLLTEIIYQCHYAGRFIPGCYTLAVSEELPEEYQVKTVLSFFIYKHSICDLMNYLGTSRLCSSLQGICQDNNVQYVPPKRV